MSRGVDPGPRATIEKLAREVYGDDFEGFLQTPRRSLEWDTPAALIERGDYEPVTALLVNIVEGHFS